MDHADSTTSYCVGDPVEVCDAEGSYYGVVIEIVNKHLLSVQMLKAGENRIYQVTDDAYHVPLGAIVQHKQLHGSDDGAPRAFDELGFRMLDGGTFVKHTDEANGQIFPIGEAAFDLVSDDDSDSVGSLKDFIVDDDKCEPFTLANDDSDFVRDTHAAVRGFNSWLPQNEQECQMRQFVLSQEARAVAIDDNLRFGNSGGAAPAYSNPA